MGLSMSTYYDEGTYQALKKLYLNPTLGFWMTLFLVPLYNT